MNNEEKRQLDQMIQANNTVDNTSGIRNERKSKKIRDCVAIIQNIKRKHNNTRDFKILDKECMPKCNYLFTNFPNIYNKLLKYQIDVKILYMFLDELESIENGEKNQHEASFEIGKLLKTMYIDPRIGEESKKPTESKREREKNINKVKNMSWADYKKLDQKKNE
jgi:hypothetical protein